MSSLKITFVQADGVEQTIDGLSTGQTLMEIGRSHGVAGILGDCGGSCACATCHVYVDAPWRERVGKADEVELATLDMAPDVDPERSRLCCQIQLRAELDGLRVTVAPAF